jgi:hypothetical protein
MTTLKTELHCLNCKKSECETPLLHLHYSGEELWICSQCLPTLIHAPQKLAGKIKNADQIEPAEKHEH